MKKIITLFALVLFCFCSITQAQVHLKGEIGVRIFESKDNPHIVEEPITITKGATVTIKKGTVFLFKNYAGLKVQGNLIIQGTKEEPVIFTSFNHRKYNPGAEMYPNAFDWNGIAIEEGSGTVELHHFKLMYSVYGVKSKNDKILINSGLFSNNGQCDVVINDKMKVVLKDEPFSYSLTKPDQPVPVEKPLKEKDTTAAPPEKEEPVPVVKTVTPPITAKPVVPVPVEKPVAAEEKKETATVAVKQEPETKPVEKAEEPKKDTVAEKVEEKEEEKESKDEESGVDKNGNRAGIRINFTWLPGDMRGRYYWDEISNSYEEATNWADEDYYDDMASRSEFWDVYYQKLFLKFNVYFVIKTGRFLTIDVGPGVAIWNNAKGYKGEFYDSTNAEFITETSEWQLMIVSPAVSTNINFVKRFYPLKINVGFFLDVNFNLTSNNQSLTYNSYLWNDISYDNFDFNINLALGPRFGLEIMAGEHFGFGTEFILRFNKIRSDIDFVDTYDQRWEFYMPLVGLAAGINFYF